MLPNVSLLAGYHKGKCLACDGVGHFAWNCPKVCFKCKGDHATDSCPNRRGWEHLPAADNDLRSTTSDLDASRANNDHVCDGDAGPVPSSASGAGVADASSAESAGDHAVDEPNSHSVHLFYFLASRSSQMSADAQSTAPLDDVRFNQLDELQTQDESPSPSVLAGLSGTVNDARDSAIRNLDATVISDSISSDDASFVHPQDVN